MNEGGINKLGRTALQPLLARIDAMKNGGDLQATIRYFHHLGIAVPFALGSAPDNHNPGQVITNIGASGLGLPDRDYYLKPEQRFQEAREKYQAHVATMFKLAGYDDAKAKASAATVFQVEKQLAEKSLDNVSLRDPQATDHKTTPAQLKKLTPTLNWDFYFKDAAIPM